MACFSGLRAGRTVAVVSESVRSAAPQLRDASRLADEDDLAHLVCCRDPAWLGGVLKGLCGVEDERVMLTAEVVCTMCLAEADRLRPGWRLEVDDICPVDGLACPDELAMLDVVSRRVLDD
jgi:hypothetical protein